MLSVDTQYLGIWHYAQVDPGAKIGQILTKNDRLAPYIAIVNLKNITKCILKLF